MIPDCSCHKVIGDEYYCEVHGGDHWQNEQVQPMAGRPATKIEVEAMGAICNLQDELREARQIIRALCGVAIARRAMGIDWMTRAELSQAIPPAYTEWLGRQLLEMLR